MTWRPMLAAPVDSDAQLQELSYPLMTSPKVDGIRILVHPELGAITRSMKPVRNRHVREVLSRPSMVGFDGEIAVGPLNAIDVFARTTSGVMSGDGTPSFTYHVFDDFQHSGGFYDRHEHVKVLMLTQDPHLTVLPYRIANTPEEVLQHETEALGQHYEGLMLRSINGKYKFNRSTFKEQGLLKLKRFEDAEATVVGFEALKRNENPATRNALGLTERSSHQAGKVADQLLGTLLVSHPDWGTFGIGSGFDVALRTEIWQDQDRFRGRKVTFKYQKVGIVDKPRFPIFKGFREDI